MKLTFNKKKAFTLIELLIVIAIIGILFIVLVSKVDFATDKAKATGVQTDFRSFQMAFDTVAKENAGFNTFGWDTGDANQDGIRNSYDEGDINKDGIQDGAEVFTGHKVYAETFTKVYSLKKNGTGSYDRDALNRLETAINANLDPKLHITIKDDGEVIMANGAQDPWNKEYHGWYITNAETDKKDRGAIVMYSDGANNEFGSEHSIANGVVTVNVSGNNKLGKDDYSIAVIYTFANGYGEVQTSTSGFSNNQTTQGNISNNSGTEDTEDTEDPDVTDLLEPGLYNAGAIALAENGDVEAAQDMIKTSWEALLAAGIVRVTNGAVYSNFNLDTWENTSSASLDGDLVLPNDGSITSIGDAVYDEDSGDPIGNIAFIFCDKLTGIAIPKGVTSITYLAFCCTGLTSVNIPNSVTSIDIAAFYECTSLTSVVIPDCMTEICEEIFWGCISLTSVTIPDSVTIIGDEAFYNCSSLTSVTIPDNVTSIGFAAFEGCENLTSVAIPDGVTYIGDWAFAYCDNLQYNEYDDAYYLGSNNNPYLLFVGVKDTNITSCTIHSKTRIIGCYAFGYSSLTSITIPDGVIQIGTGAFYECTSLTSITIPDSVTNIGFEAFSCKSLTNIEVDTNNQYYKSIDGNLYTKDGKTLVQYARGKADISFIIPDSVISIGDWAFAYCTNLTSITFNGSVEQWNAVTKGFQWKYLASITEVVCLDGIVKLQ